MDHESTPADRQTIDSILNFWFEDDGAARFDLWFAQNDEFDEEIRTRFGALLPRAAAGDLDHWSDDARGRLALIILLDQFSRNLERESGRAYDNDGKAQTLCLTGIEAGHDRELPPVQRWFFYMPLQHAEDLALQDKSVAVFEALLEEAPRDKKKMFEGALDYAHKHRDVIVTFGRFPHRNQDLGRTSTPEEEAHLATGNRFL